MSVAVLQFGSTIAQLVATSTPAPAASLHLNIDETIAAKSKTDYYQVTGGEQYVRLGIKQSTVPPDLWKVQELVIAYYHSGVVYSDYPAADVSLWNGATPLSVVKGYNLVGVDVIHLFKFLTGDLLAGELTRAEALALELLVNYKDKEAGDETPDVES